MQRVEHLKEVGTSLDKFIPLLVESLQGVVKLLPLHMHLYSIQTSNWALNTFPSPLPLFGKKLFDDYVLKNK